MRCSVYAIFLIILITLGSFISITGCISQSNPKNNTETALSIALGNSEIKSEIAHNNNYKAQVENANFNKSGYLNLQGSFYRVTIDTANVHYNLLVDVEQQRQLEFLSKSDVIVQPTLIKIPANSTWYRTLHVSHITSYPPQTPTFRAYVGIDPYPEQAFIDYLVMDKLNFDHFASGVTYTALDVSSITGNLTSNKKGSSIMSTSLSDVVVTPGDTVPGIITTRNGARFSLTYDDTSAVYYLVIHNRGTEDVAVEVSTYVTSTY